MSDEARTIEVPAVRSADVALATELSTDDIINRLKKIVEVQHQAMKKNVDFGVIPGTGKDKDGKERQTLLKPGAEKLCVLFRLDPQFESERLMTDGHLTVITKCIIFHQVTGQRLGASTAMCSTHESKYAYRKGNRVCPECQSDAVFKDKKGAGYYCWSKKGGCGVQFKSADQIRAIEAQSVGRVVNEDVADQFSTVLRMAEKRALVAAVRLVTGASAIFDEEMAEREDDRSEDESASNGGNPENNGHAKPTDLCTVLQRNALLAAAEQKIGDRDQAIDWLKTRIAMDDIGIQNSKDLTVKSMQTVMGELLAMGRGEESQALDPELENFKTAAEQEADIPF